MCFTIFHFRFNNFLQKYHYNVTKIFLAGLQHYDPDFYAYLKSHQADDLLFCYRWLLLEMKREFALDDALRMLEVLWAALPASPPTGELSLAEVPFPPPSPPPSPNVKHIRENAYTKVCAIRRQSSSASIAASIKRKALSTEDPTLQSATEVNGETKRFLVCIVA